MTPAFRTHLNYIKHMKKLFNGCALTVCFGNGHRRTGDIRRFWKLYDVTRKSIKRDMELAQEDHAFALIAAPWFPVKCYYALYYLESVLAHLIDGSMVGFGKSGHSGVRKKIATLVTSGQVTFSVSELGAVRPLTQVRAIPKISAGQNTRHDFWQKAECTGSLCRKLMDYKLHELGKTNNFRTKKGKAAKADFIAKESLMLPDFFYWYRIKANYRDLDYIDFENGIGELDVYEYMKTYFDAFDSYRALLDAEVRTKFTPS